MNAERWKRAEQAHVESVRREPFAQHLHVLLRSTVVRVRAVRVHFEDANGHRRGGSAAEIALQ